MQVQRFAEDGEAPQPVRGDRASKPVAWMGDSVSVSKALKRFRSMAMRREISAKSTVLRRDWLEVVPEQLISRCVRPEKHDNPRMNAGTLVAAWNRGGYWYARSSVVSSSSYLA